MSARPRQRFSHNHLLNDVRSTAPAVTTRPLDAIVVPTARPSSQLQGVIDLAADLGVQLLVLCSGASDVSDVVRAIERTPGAGGTAVEIPEGYVLQQAPRRTSAPRLLEPSGGRASDLSVKRNLGVLFARMSGWHKILFLDDDIVDVSRHTIRRLETQLDVHQVAGMWCRDFPDNSVVCHARRRVGHQQGVFVSGAALGVNCTAPMGFFPDVYNEDWFFLAPIALQRSLPLVGDARQDEYDPFRRPERARHEEFGDLIAEGLYALFGEQPGHDLHRYVRDADDGYWSDFIEVRRSVIEDTMSRLARRENDQVAVRAYKSLESAQAQLELIRSSSCAEYVHEWLDDIKDWEATGNGIVGAASPSDVLADLGLSIWSTAGRVRELVAG